MLKELLGQIDEQKKILETEIDPESPTFRMVVGNKVKAPDEIKKLKEKYKEELVKKAVVAIAYGEKSSFLASEAENEYEMAVVRADSLIRNALAGVDLRYYIGRDFNPNTFGIIMQAVDAHLEGSEIDPPMDVRYQSNLYSSFLATEDDFYKTAMIAVQSVYGLAPIVREIMMEMSKKALTEGFDGDIFPVMLLSQSEAEAKSLSNTISGSVLMQGGGDKEMAEANGATFVEDTKESVESAMGVLKQSIKSESPNKKNAKNKRGSK